MEPDLSNRVGAAGERFVPGESSGELIETEHVARYWWASALADGRRVLDAGCGVGYGTAMLARAGASEAIGVDISTDAVRAASSGLTDRVSFREADVRALPFEDASFDLVVCFEVIEHVAEQDAVIAELARVLRPAGLLAVSSPNRDVYPAGNPHHVREYVPDELRAALGHWFADVELYRQHDWTTSAVLSDAQAANAALNELSDLHVGKTLAQGPGSERYTVALASRAPLPLTPGRAVLGGGSAVQAWLQEIRELSDARFTDAQLIAALEDERDRARADVQTLQGVEDRLREEQVLLLDQLESLRIALRAVRTSLPWRASVLARRLIRRTRPRRRAS